MTAKLARLEADNRPPHLIVVSGSNGYYSIDSKALSTALGMAVTNAAIQWSYAAYVLDRVAERAKTGDIVLLPLEYEYFTIFDGMPALEACHLITQDRQRLSGAWNFATALLNCSPSVIFNGFRLELVAKLGVPYPAYDPAEAINAEGDILENVPATATWRQPTRGTMPRDMSRPFGNQRIAAAIRILVAKNVRVFLTYPVQPEVSGNFPVVRNEWTQEYRDWAASLGAKVISTPEAHLFPVDCFFDSRYHLHQGCTARNSEIYAQALRDAPL